MEVMKAITYTQYGSPDVLNMTNVKKPVPKENEMLVKIHAASANPADWHMIRGKPLFARFGFGLFKPKNTIPGIDISGEIESVGKNVTWLKPGDEVFGECGWGGGFAEYVCVPGKSLVIKPKNISFEEAASVTVAAITALQGLHYKGAEITGQNVLINGASGGVGTFAVQIARSFGAKVTGVCSSGNAKLVRSIGAEHVIDYTKQDFSQTEQKYDFILDAVGNRSVSDYKRALTPNGKCVIVGFTTMGRMFRHALLGSLQSSSKGKTIALMGTAQPNEKDLETLKTLLESGSVKPVIDRNYPLTEAAEAMHYLETGHARGKVIITVV